MPLQFDPHPALLGSLLLPDCPPETLEAVRQTLDAKDFPRIGETALYTAILAVYDATGKTDVLLVKEELERRDELLAAGGIEGLANLAEGIPSPANAVEYAQTIKEQATKRAISRLAAQVQHQADNGVDSATLIAQVEEGVRALTARTDTPIRTIGDDIESAVARILEPNPGLRGIPSGLHELDDVLLGFEPGHLYVIGARASAGKSSMLLGFALHAAVQERIPVTLISVEDSRMLIQDKAIAQLAGLDLHRVRRGGFADAPLEEQQHVTDAAAKLADAPLTVVDQSGIRIDRLTAIARQAVRQHGSQAIFVDYLQKIVGPDSAENRTQAVGAITSALKHLARTAGVPVIAAAQLNREVERRKSARPCLADLRESGDIEQDADAVILIHRAGKDAKRPDAAELIVAKNRVGPTASIHVRFDAPSTRFLNIEMGEFEWDEYEDERPKGRPPENTITDVVDYLATVKKADTSSIAVNLNTSERTARSLIASALMNGRIKREQTPGKVAFFMVSTVPS